MPVPALGPTQLPNQWVLGVVSWSKVTRVLPLNHSLPSGVEVDNEWSSTSIPPICLHGVDMDNLTLF